MPIRSACHLTAIAVLALTTVAAAAACGSATAPGATGQSPGTATSGTAAPSVPDPIASHAGSSPPACMGAVIYRVDADAGSSKRSVCIAVGGVVRVENLGPGNLSVSPSSLVSCWYEAAVTECRLIRTGTVTFETSGEPKVGPLTVMVAEASSPPKPSPACLSATTYTVDASDSGPPWAALCVKLDVVVRVENLGPAGLSADPADMVSCRYEAGVWNCRFVKAGTMTITTVHQVEPRSLTLVVVR